MIQEGVILQPDGSKYSRNSETKIRRKYFDSMMDRDLLKFEYKRNGLYGFYYTANQEVIYSLVKFCSFYFEEETYNLNRLKTSYKEAYSTYTSKNKKPRSFTHAFLDMFFPYISTCPDNPSKINTCDPFTRFLRYFELHFIPRKFQDPNESLDNLLIKHLLNTISLRCPRSYMPHEVLDPMLALEPRQRYKKIVRYISKQISEQEEHIIKEYFGDNWKDTIHSKIKKKLYDERDYQRGWIKKSTPELVIKLKAESEEKYNTILKTIESLEKQ